MGLDVGSQPDARGTKWGRKKSPGGNTYPGSSLDHFVAPWNGSSYLTRCTSLWAEHPAPSKSKPLISASLSQIQYSPWGPTTNLMGRALFLMIPFPTERAMSLGHDSLPLCVMNVVLCLILV